MCDGSSIWNPPGWNPSFYHQYIQQHAQMTQWLEQLHSNIPGNSCISPLPNNQAHNCCMQCIPSTCRHEPTSFVQHDESHNIEYEGEELEQEEELDYSDENEDECSSEDELVFNADAFIALRASKDDSSDKESEESFELIDSVKEDLFEYVELNTFGRLESKIGTKAGPDVEGESQYEKEQRRLLYGEKADSIAGLETMMAINFDHLCDVHQPHLWPVLPVVL